MNDVVPKVELDYVNPSQKQWSEILENKPAGTFIAFVHVCVTANDGHYSIQLTLTLKCNLDIHSLFPFDECDNFSKVNLVSSS